MQKNNTGDKSVKSADHHTPERESQSSFGAPQKPFYQPEDVIHISYRKDLGDPGSFPFTRGIHPEMYRVKLWTMRQYAGYATAEESNRRYRYLLSQGQTGLSVAFDLPTQIGLDSDDPLAAGEVGKAGVAIDSIDDIDRLFEDIPLDSISISMTINAPASIILSMYYAVARRRGISGSQLRGTIQNDILKEYIARGTYIFPAQQSLRMTTDTFHFCAKEIPQWNPISVSGYHVREAGSTAAQEIAFTLANAIVYTEKALNAGLELRDFAARISFFFNSHNNLFEEVAKFRAARKIWARLMVERFHCDDPACGRMRFHAQTAGSTLTAQQPDNNVVRVSFQALAAVLGGAQSLHANGKDEALALPTEESATLALRTQQILAHETGVAEMADPLGGSYLIESLTAKLETESWSYLEKIDRMGGMLRAIETGFVQKEIQEAAYRQQKRIENHQQIVVGVNRFVDSATATVPLLQVDGDLERRQVEKVRAVRAGRNRESAESAVAILKDAARNDGDNLLYPILKCVEMRVTIGEIVKSLKGVFGEHHETVVI